MKKKLLVSFSGGETSAFMAQWLWNHKQDEYEMIFVFANTGEENEETLEFVRDCEKYFGFPIVWVEALITPEFGEGTKHKIVDFNSASRNGEPFESLVAKCGIPNIANPQCTRELKERPITSYANSIGWKKHETAIGIRSDECDRINAKAKSRRLIYPLISKLFIPMTKPKINFWWRLQPFRLKLKGYEGNCKACWKKSYKKLLKIAQEKPESFDFPKRIEAKYGNYFPPHRAKKFISEGKEVPRNITFFRNSKSALQILKESKTAKPIIIDDSMIFAIQEELDFEQWNFENEDLIGGDSCEVFSSCGD